MLTGKETHRLSRGPGTVERALLNLMAREPDGAFTVEDLCERIYGCAAEKKHRVSIIRALNRIIKRPGDWDLFQAEITGSTLVLVNLDNVMSYALGQLKREGGSHYRDKRKLTQGWRPEDLADEAALRAELAPGGRHYDSVRPGGAWMRHVEIYRAERDGKPEKAARMRAELKAKYGRI